MSTSPIPGPRSGPQPAGEAWPTKEGLGRREGRTFYTVPDIGRMEPFLMSIVSDGDRWMFVSSNGALTAGRRDATQALFAYETEDRLHPTARQVGPATAIRLEGSPTAWRPFLPTDPAPGRRSLHKSIVGDEISFVESHGTSGLQFSYRWTSADRFGFVREATLTNRGTEPLSVDLVDGLLDVLPWGLEPAVYRAMGNLTNAYKRSEVILDDPHPLAVYSLESPVSDRPEPAEVLRATATWSAGFDGSMVSLDRRSMIDFERGETVEASTKVTGVAGAYLLSGRISLDPGMSASWLIVSDVALDQSDITELRGFLSSDVDVRGEVTAATQGATRRLTEMMARSDGLQATGNAVASAHHFSNTTYNVMRGGIPLAGYTIDAEDFTKFVSVRNRLVAKRAGDLLASLPPRLPRDELGRRVGDHPDLRRLAREYLPFSFSRRHGDPSRPWNTFSIRVRDEEGRPVIYHEGNWRDIFQNWEALATSYPAYLPAMITTFLNASTADGFNPYRITRDGVDWETPEPDNPWAHIGYWGDHQLIYLLRLLEAADRLVPGDLARSLTDRRFTYADVPYRLASHSEMLRNPKATITFDEAAALRTMRREEEIGTEGRLLATADGRLVLVSMIEKLLVPALTKLSSYVPGGGIWMNTQRPEWNDANNALAGYGLSMVTLFHLRRYLDHLKGVVELLGSDPLPLSSAVADWLADVSGALADHEPPGDDPARLFHELGHAFERYRERLYTDGIGGTAPVDPASLDALCDTALAHLDATIRSSRRPDGLFHSYNLARFDPATGAVEVEHLPEMLEGQVAAIDSGLLSPQETVDLVDALYRSGMYAEDRRSFMLYPPRRLPSFLDRNVLPHRADSIPLVAALLQAADSSVVVRDPGGTLRFAPDLATHDDLVVALDELATDPGWAPLVEVDGPALIRLQEEVFGHHDYTGRSGSMYGYEGIGSIYWHMVAKLLVAVQESLLVAQRNGAAPTTIERLAGAYERVRDGLGYNRTAAEFGAIPIDPYSHTPAHSGAQQPGMTGLVKEELLTRWLELGVAFEDGGLRFDPVLISPDEPFREPHAFEYLDVDGIHTTIELPAGSFGFTLCQVPIVVARGDEDSVVVRRRDGSELRVGGRRLGADPVSEVYARSGEVRRIDVVLAPS